LLLPVVAVVALLVLMMDLVAAAEPVVILQAHSRCLGVRLTPLLSGAEAGIPLKAQILFLVPSLHLVVVMGMAGLVGPVEALNLMAVLAQVQQDKETTEVLALMATLTQAVVGAVLAVLAVTPREMVVLAA
jgi:hypothetical protein